MASWSSIDYFCGWKQLHYHAKRFYAPVLVTAIRKTPETVEIRISSDLQAALKGMLKLSLYKISGEIVSQEEIPVDLGAQEAVMLKTIPLAELTGTPSEDFLWLEFCGESSGRKIQCTNECWLAKPKEYQLQKAEIRHRIFQGANGEMYLELAAEKPAFYVFAEFKGAQAVFSDNSFTLLPGKEKILQIRMESPKSAAELEKMLVIRSLRDSYAE